MEEWRVIDGFPGYSVSSLGRVRNDDTGRIMALSRNQVGVIQVGLMKGYSQYKRSVTVLVAKAFLPHSETLTFDTSIHLDGDKENNRVENLMWRPRWFAVKYHQQFHNDERGFLVPIQEIHTNEWFPTSWEAAVKYGLLDKEIRIATMNRTFVFPTYQEFRVVQN